MGGKALNKYNVFTERKDTGEFLMIGNEIQESIRNDFNLPIETDIVRCYHTKKDHGDLDLLLKIDNNFNSLGIDINDYILKRFNPRAINNNGGVISFDYKNFQIDIIPIKESKFDIAKIYFSYDPLGNIMGKTFHKLNLSYGWDGLTFKFRNFNGRNSQNIEISNDPRKIFGFGGYDYDRFLQGFDTLEEIMLFCINSEYFDAEMFKMENLNHIDRKRNKKRGSYNVFLKYIKDNGIDTRYEFKKNKEDYIPIINSYFPEAELIRKLDDLKENDMRNKIISQKFNGDIIMSWIPNIVGKELGRLIDRFKNSFDSKDNYCEFVLNSNYQTIKDRFMETYGQFKNEQ